MKKKLNPIMKQICYLAIVSVLLVTCLAQKRYVTNNDKMVIVNYVLNHTNFKSDLNINDKVIYLSSENLPDNILSLKTKTINGLRIELLNPTQIKEKTAYGFYYYFFEPFEIKKNEIKVRFFRKFNNSTYRAFYSFGVGYSCKKTNKRWKCKVSEFNSQMS